ncbi:MAG TPA: hypothetical protein VMX13_00700 [Sedimentisphaerales bacterium]|nr:hypothetical protein [Sedimentisphaerales bacterium]
MAVGLLEKQKMEEDERLFNLYKLAIQEQQYFLSEHQKRVGFYMGLISALLAGTVAGFFKCERWYHYIVLTLGPISMGVVANIAIQGVDRLYQRFLEAITVIKKLEVDFGLARDRTVDGQNLPTGVQNNLASSDSSWMLTEPLIPYRYLQSGGGGTSKGWVDARMRLAGGGRRNYNGVVCSLFSMVRGLGIVLTFFLLIIGAVKLSAEHPEVGQKVSDLLRRVICGG